MADTKVSALTSLTGAGVDTAADVLPIVDTSATTTKKITVDDLKTSMALPSAADQSDQEAATSTTTYVSPSRQHFHPSAPKAWGKVTSPTTVDISYGGTASVSNTATGKFVVTHGRTFSSSNYAVVATAIYDPAGGTFASPQIVSQTTTTFTVMFANTGGGGVAVTGFNYACFGDL